MVSTPSNSTEGSPTMSTYHYEFAPEYAHPATEPAQVSGYPYIPHNATTHEREACNIRIRALLARNANYLQPIQPGTPKSEACRASPETKASGANTPTGKLATPEPFTDTYSSGEEESDSNGPHTPYNCYQSPWKGALDGEPELKPTDHPYLQGKKIYFGSYKYFPPVPPPIPQQERTEELLSDNFTTAASSAARKELCQAVYEFHTLVLGFKFPSNLEFTTPRAGELPKLAHTPASKPLLEHNHKLEKLLERLDAIESRGDKEIQRMRKQAVERMLSELDGLKRMESMALYNFNYERGINA
ncbi:unnamed protein product [Rhizoctonia solani]|uniref:BAG domain-containing protein n=1 Tax=Rhizoctonia solani TaxID=456999 RepID=A0A8H2WFT4_9AGAM|nr:unnamed protein product [Rhizoctonia solani]